MWQFKKAIIEYVVIKQLIFQINTHKHIRDIPEFYNLFSYFENIVDDLTY